jgi:hypothetical protein
MPTINFPTIDLSKLTANLPFELPFDLPTIELPTVELPTFNFADLKLPRVDLPKLDFAGVDVPSPEQVIEWFRDAVFAGIGLVALTAERVAELQKQIVEFVTAQAKR